VTGISGEPSRALLLTGKLQITKLHMKTAGNLFNWVFFQLLPTSCPSCLLVPMINAALGLVVLSQRK